MHPMRHLRLLAALVLCLVAVPAASALAARKGAASPVISSIGPASVSVGETLTIRGRNFLAGAKRNTVIFKRDGARAISVKAGRSTRTRIEVVVPASLGVVEPTRFRVRVRARTFSSGYTAPKRSVLVEPLADALDTAGCGAGDLGAAVGDLTGIDALGDVADDLLTPGDCGSGDGADPGDGGTGADPADDEPLADPGAADPWDAPGAGDTSGLPGG